MVNKYYKSFDGWRGILALLICIAHLKINGHLYQSFIIVETYVYVQFFFVLSGFIMCLIYYDKLSNTDTLKFFIIKRFSRLYPVHIMLIIFLVILELMFISMIKEYTLYSRDPFTENKSIYSLVTNIFFLQGMGFHERYTWNTVSHPVSVEFYTCLLFGILCYYFKKYLNQIALVFVIISSYFLYAKYDSLSNFHLLFRSICGFFAGVLCFKIFGILKNKFSNINSIKIWTFLEVLSILFLSILVGIEKSNLSSVYLTIGIIIPIVVFGFEKGLVSKFLMARFFNFLGKIAYSLYMTHGIVFTCTVMIARILENKLDIKLFKRNDNAEILDIYLGNNLFEGDFYYLIIISISIFVAYLTNILIEEPIKKKLRKKL